ncbi:hypothetical protein QZH41_005949 [Actinostola sp. cb2023]|nr:hypothetical protein QZH41_005949 [Actinostola sp. cb2023]
MLIRRTWGPDYAVLHRWKTVFLLSENDNKQDKDRSVVEERIYGDIIRGVYGESFFNMSFKVAMGFEWALKFCKFDYLLKTDDDTFVNTHGILDYLNKRWTLTKKLYTGNPMMHGSVLREGRYAVKYESGEKRDDELNKTLFSPYCSGGGFLLSLDVVSAMFNCSEVRWQTQLGIANELRNRSDQSCVKSTVKRLSQLAKSKKMMLSIGWTTGNDMKPVKNMYTWNNVLEMGKLVGKISQPVTFPVRASLVKRSLEQLLWLLDISRNLTLTVWSSEKDDVKASDLVELRKKVYDKKNVYYDLPKSQADAFAKALEGVDVSTKYPYDNYNNNRVIGGLRSYATEMCTDVLVGETKVMFTGKGGWVSTTKEVKATYSRETVHMFLDVFFLSLGLPDIEQSITLVFGSNGLSGSPTASVKPSDGVQLTLKRTGELTVIKPDGSKTKSQGVSDPKFQYSISLWYGPKMDHITFVLRGKTNGTELPSIKYKGDFKPEKQYVLIGVGAQQGAVLVDKYDGAYAQPSGSGSSITTPLNLLLLTLVTILFVSSAVMLV